MSYPTSAYTNVQQLSNDIFFYKSSTEQTAKSGDPVSLIVVCSWMDGNPRAIAKYTNTYRQMYPTADILLIQSFLPHVTYVSNQSRKASLAPACEIFKAHQRRAEEQGGHDSHKILLHAFSNAGALCAIQLLSALGMDSSQSGLRALVLDSCPSQPRLGHALKAVQYGLQGNILLRLMGLLAAYLVLAYIVFCDIVLGIHNSVELARRRLNDCSLVPKTVPRLYLHSKEDAIVPYADVTAHADEARRLGFAHVLEVGFETGRHVALINADEKKYWTSIEQILQAH